MSRFARALVWIVPGASALWLPIDFAAGQMAAQELAAPQDRAAPGDGTEYVEVSLNQLLAGLRSYPDDVVAAIATLGKHENWQPTIRTLLQNAQEQPVRGQGDMPVELREALDLLGRVPELLGLALAAPDATRAIAQLQTDSAQELRDRIAKLRSAYAVAERDAAHAWQQALEQDPVALGAYRDLLTQFCADQQKANTAFACVAVTDRRYYFACPPDDAVLAFARDQNAPAALQQVLSRWFESHGPAACDAKSQDVGTAAPAAPAAASPTGEAYVIDLAPEARRAFWQPAEASGGNVIGQVPVILQAPADQPNGARLARAVLETQRLWSPAIVDESGPADEAPALAQQAEPQTDLSTTIPADVQPAPGGTEVDWSYITQAQPPTFAEPGISEVAPLVVDDAVAGAYYVPETTVVYADPYPVYSSYPVYSYGYSYLSPYVSCYTPYYGPSYGYRRTSYGVGLSFYFDDRDCDDHYRYYGVRYGRPHRYYATGVYRAPTVVRRTTVSTPVVRRTAISTPSGRRTTVTAPSGRRTTVTAPSGRRTTVTAPSGRRTTMTAPSVRRDGTTSISPRYPAGRDAVSIRRYPSNGGQRSSPSTIRRAPTTIRRSGGAQVAPAQRSSTRVQSQRAGTTRVQSQRAGTTRVQSQRAGTTSIRRNSAVRPSRSHATTTYRKSVSRRP